MSYPYDAPAAKLSGYWSDGAYTPFDTVSYIRDDVTPINKNAMVNSVGKQLSLLENFVNTTYLARSGNYIQDGYVKVIHTQGLMSSGYDVTQYEGHPDGIPYEAWGYIYLCSHLVPNGDNDLSLGEYRTGLTNRWKKISTVEIHGVFLSGYAGSTLFASGAAGGSLLMACDLYPENTNSKNIGTASNRFAGMNASGLYSNILETNYLISPDFIDSSTIGNIYICSNLLAQSMGVDLGTMSHRFGRLYINEIFLNTAQTSDNGLQLWVDVSGYVRRAPN